MKKKLEGVLEACVHVFGGWHVEFIHQTGSWYIYIYLKKFGNVR